MDISCPTGYSGIDAMKVTMATQIMEAMRVIADMQSMYVTKIIKANLVIEVKVI